MILYHQKQTKNGHVICVFLASESIPTWNWGRCIDTWNCASIFIFDIIGGLQVTISPAIISHFVSIHCLTTIGMIFSTNLWSCWSWKESTYEIFFVNGTLQSNFRGGAVMKSCKNGQKKVRFKPSSGCHH